VAELLTCAIQQVGAQRVIARAVGWIIPAQQQYQVGAGGTVTLLEVSLAPPLALPKSSTVAVPPGSTACAVTNGPCQ
jgi:hypothetical protein